MKHISQIFIYIIFFTTAAVQAKTWFVAPNGSNTNSGTIDAPFAGIMQAQKQLSPGDTVYIRGGNYIIAEQQIAQKQKIWAMVHVLNKSGAPGKRIHYTAYPGEKPVFDFSQVKPENLRIMAFNITGSWIHIKGIEVVGVQVTILGHTQSECFHNEGNHNIYENLAMHHGQAIGFYLIKGSDNQVLNCDAYLNADYTSEGGRGGNVDGFGCHPQPGSVNNVFRGCRAWFNSDDGYDCIRAAETVTFDSCWAMYNGYSADFKKLGDGNGFKAGGWGLKMDRRTPTIFAGHVVSNSVAVGNRANGFYANHHPGGSLWTNNKAYHNGTNYNMLNRDSAFTQDVPGYGHRLINNISYKPRTYETQHIDTTRCTLSNNSFQWNIKLSNKDFMSTDEKQLLQTRKPDGNLPDITFLKLKK